MGRPCSSCGKLASLEIGDPEVDSVDISDGSITASVRLVKTSACCGDEMKEYTYELDTDFSDELVPHVQEFHPDLKEGDDVDISGFSVSEGDCEVTERGGGRYAKAYTGVTLNVEITCDNCDWTYSGILQEETPNSNFEEL